MTSTSKGPKRPRGWGARHTMAIMGFWAMCILYALRFNLSIAIVAMVQSEESEQQTNSDLFSSEERNGQISNKSISELEGTCLHLKQRFDETIDLVENPRPRNRSRNARSMGLINESSDDDINRGFIARVVSASRKKTESLKQRNREGSSKGEFNWTRQEQGIILGSFFWGHVFTQIPGGLLAQRYGPKWPLGFGILFTAILSLVTPWAARTDKTALIVVRILQGLSGGVVWPAMHLVLGKWAPKDERSKLVSIVYAGPQFGTAAAMIACGYLIDWNVFGGWPSCFYVLGGSSLIWFVFWCFLMYNTPASHPRISPEELHYIEESIGSQASEKKLPVPWRAIFTSVPFWAICVAHVGEDWGLYTLLTELPTYMKTVLHFNIRENAFLSALPQFFRWGFSIALTYFADYLIHKNILRVVTVRKICNSIAHWGAAIALIGVSYLGCDAVMTIVVITLAVGINGAVNGGCITNHVDIAANHAGILMGLTNTAANICGIIAPYVAGNLTNKSASLDNWQIVLFIAAGIYIVDNLVYVLFASGTEQPWNRRIEKKDTNNYAKHVEQEPGSASPQPEDKLNETNAKWIVVNEITADSDLKS